LTLSKHLTALQETSLSKLDVEHLVAQQWQDELDPHIQSHYDFKMDALAHLDHLDSTLQDTIDGHLKNHPLLSSSTAVRSSSICCTGFHQQTLKDFSVFKLQKELKEIKLFGGSLKDIEISWDAILRTFMKLCQVNQAYPYYHDHTPTFDFEIHFVESIKPPKYLPVDHDQAKHNYCSFGDVLCIFLQNGTAIVNHPLQNHIYSYYPFVILIMVLYYFALWSFLSVPNYLEITITIVMILIHLLLFLGNILVNFFNALINYPMRLPCQASIMRTWLYWLIILFTFYDLQNVLL
jgi:hypothetical protein